MTTTAPRQPETDSFDLEPVRIPADTEDDFRYEEVAVEDDWSLADGEEDLEALVRAITERAEDGASAAPKLDPRPGVSRAAGQPEVVDDFLRNFLLNMGMTNTLDCFQTEWSEFVQKGLVDTELVGLVPEVYTQNQLLDGDLKNAQRERDEYKAAASAATETLVKLQKARDFHRLQHKRVVQERNRLIETMRKLKMQIEDYEPAVKQMNEKYQAALKQKTLVSLERDKAVGQANSARATLHDVRPPPDTPSYVGTGDGAAQGPKPDKGARCQTDGRYDPSKDPTKTFYTSKHAKDSEFPVDMRNDNPFIHLRHQSTDTPVTSKVKVDNFSLTNTLKAHSRSISCLASHPTKLVVASSSDDRLWRLWGLPEGDLIATGEGHTDWLSGVSFHPDETKLGTTGGDGSLRIWDLFRGCLVLTLQGHAGATWGCSFHSCGNFVASCSMDYTVKVWDLQSARCRSTLRGHTGSVNSVEFLPSSNLLLTSSADKTLALWDARTALCTQTLNGHSSSCNHATFSSSGQAIASCDSHGVVMLRDVRNLTAPSVVVETGPHPSNQVAFGPGGQTLAVAGDDGSVRVLELATKRSACTLRHEDAVQSVAFDHKGEHLLSGASDGQIYVWS